DHERSDRSLSARDGLCQRDKTLASNVSPRKNAGNVAAGLRSDQDGPSRGFALVLFSVSLVASVVSLLLLFLLSSSFHPSSSLTSHRLGARSHGTREAQPICCRPRDSSLVVWSRRAHCHAKGRAQSLPTGQRSARCGRLAGPRGARRRSADPPE